MRQVRPSHMRVVPPRQGTGSAGTSILSSYVGSNELDRVAGGLPTAISERPGLPVKRPLQAMRRKVSRHALHHEVPQKPMGEVVARTRDLKDMHDDEPLGGPLLASQERPILHEVREAGCALVFDDDGR